MIDFIVTIVQPTNYVHSAFDEVSLALVGGLNRLGKSAVIEKLTPDNASNFGKIHVLVEGPSEEHNNTRYIVLGTSLLGALPPIHIPKGSIVYGAEAFGTEPFNRELPHLLAATHTWNFSQYNIDRLKEQGIYSTLVLPDSIHSS